MTKEFTVLLFQFITRMDWPILLQLLQKLDSEDYIQQEALSTLLNDLGIAAEKVEDLTTYPSILGGRVKTLHPSVFGGILARRDNAEDLSQLSKYKIPEIDLVIVDLYPFEETLKSADDEEEIIEKIDIGGISLIRAAAKNYNDVLVVSGREQYPDLLELLKGKGRITFCLKTDDIMRPGHFRHLLITILQFSNILTGSQVFRHSGRALIYPILCVMAKILIRKEYFMATRIRF